MYVCVCVRYTYPGWGSITENHIGNFPVKANLAIVKSFS